MDSNIPDKEQTKALKHCVKNLYGVWKKVTPSQVNITQLRGGLSNRLYRCTLDSSLTIEGDEPKEVLLRLYGRPQDDKEPEIEIFNQLAVERLGPTLYSKFPQGRIEEYLPSNPLSRSQMSEELISRAIAKKLFLIHQLPVRSLQRTSTWLIDKFVDFVDFIESRRNIPIEFRYDALESTKNTAAEMMAADFKEELRFLTQVLKKSKEPIVFSHNDLHQNNILLSSDSGRKLEDRIVLIDFEYSSYNYRGFDLANHLSEWSFDYTGDKYPFFSASLEWFPSEKQQREFASYYIDHSSQNLDKSSREEMIEFLVEGMRPFFMACNFLWCVWAIKEACTSSIDFGYWEMAKYKWDFYLFCKKQYKLKTATENSCLPILQSSKM